MTMKRKQTPDVLGEILGGSLQAIEAETTLRSGKLQTAGQAGVWEYTVVSFQEYKGWRPRYINGRELKDWANGPLIHEYLEAMGEDGWELAAASAGERLYGRDDTHQLYFKRPK